MKKIFIALLMVCAAISANAQNSKFRKPVEQQAPRRGLFDSGESKAPIDKKYLEGACPEVDGKIVWQEYIYADTKTAKEIYDIVLAYLQKMSKEENQTEKSQVAVVNEEEYQIGARFSEKMVFMSTAFSLDQAIFNYQLLVYCIDGRCEVVIRNMSYIYEENRGGGQFPAEDMISDSYALNKKKDGFHKGGIKKFRMKTIDRKNEIIANIRKALAE